MMLAKRIVGMGPRSWANRKGKSVWIIAASLSIFVVWAANAPLEEVVRGVGRIVPSMNNQIIQNLEGGIVNQIFVSEGDLVEAGQLIVSMDKTQLGSAYAELEAQRLALSLRLERLQAEGNGSSDYIPNAELADLAPEFTESEQVLFRARREQYHNAVRNLEDAVHLREEEARRLRSMASSSAVSAIEVLRAEQSLTDVKARLDATITEFEEARAQEYSEVLSNLRQIQEALLAKEDQLGRADVVTPIRGIVNRVMATTIGGVVRPGDPLVEILSLEGALRVEGQISPSDIGFVYVGMPATIKLTAYDFSIYGTLSGSVVHVGADTVIDEQSRDRLPYFEVFVELDDTRLEGPDGFVEIRPGMQAQLELRSGERTVLQYLLKPLFKASEALTER